MARERQTDSGVVGRCPTIEAPMRSAVFRALGAGDALRMAADWVDANYEHGNPVCATFDWSWDEETLPDGEWAVTIVREA